MDPSWERSNLSFQNQRLRNSLSNRGGTYPAGAGFSSNVILEANQAEKWVFESNWLEMKSFLQKVGLNRTFCSQTLTVSFKKHWISLAETTVAAHRAATDSERCSLWWRRRELNPFGGFRITLQKVCFNRINIGESSLFRLCEFEPKSSPMRR
jgi:hypothetical protein